MTVDLNDPEAGAAIATVSMVALAGVCLAGSRWAGTDTWCRFVVRRPLLLAALAALGVHLAFVAVDERRS